jgi:hypothetical protein
MEFAQLLQRLGKAIELRDIELLRDCFTPDGIYDDYFFGPKQGSQGLLEMLDHFYAGGRAFRWEFFDPVCVGQRGYASYRFSYESLQPQALGRRVGFDGISCIELRDGRIQRYREVFDRSLALAQQDFEPARIVRLALRNADKLRADPAWAGHFAQVD